MNRLKRACLIGVNGAFGRICARKLHAAGVTVCGTDLPSDAVPEETLAECVPGTIDTLLKPENKGQLTSVLTYHVVSGAMTSKQIAAAIKAGGGQATLTTVQGEPLTAKMQGGKLVLTDAKGDASTVTVKDVIQSNGVIHVVDTVLMP